MKIAILGTRGIPARYGGFETFAEELSIRLARRGHQVTVYCRSGPELSQYEGVRRQYVPTIHHKYFDTIVHTFLSTLHLVFHRRDAALYCNAANALLTLLPRMAGIPVALNVDGLERKRRKWNWLARSWYLFSEWLATFCPAATVTDARSIAEYYMEHYGKATRFIPYGAEIGRVETADALRSLGLEPRQYFLYVSRLEPENNAVFVREAYERLETSVKLALIGDAPYAGDYIRRLRTTNDARVIMPGAIYGTGYHELTSHCLAYIHATEVGGTHPALIEAMGRGTVVLYLRTRENEEVAAGAGIPFEDDLTGKLQAVLAMTEAERQEWGARAVARVRDRYSWDAVTTTYENLFRQLGGN